MISQQNKESTIIRHIVSFSGTILFLVLILIIFSLARNIVKIGQAKKEISEAKKRVEKLKEENIELQKRLEEVRSQTFIEKQIRDKLGLAKEGEIVVVLPDKEVLKKLVPEREEEEDILPDPTWKKWLKLFY